MAHQPPSTHTTTEIGIIVAAQPAAAAAHAEEPLGTKAPPGTFLHRLYYPHGHFREPHRDWAGDAVTSRHWGNAWRRTLLSDARALRAVRPSVPLVVNPAWPHLRNWLGMGWEGQYGRSPPLRGPVCLRGDVASLPLVGCALLSQSRVFRAGFSELFWFNSNRER